MSRRRRRTAAEIAGQGGRGGWFTIAMIGIGLAVVIFFKVSINDSDSELLRKITGDPELELPSSVLDDKLRTARDGGVRDAHPADTLP
jgi:hypothetical protein